MKVADNYSSAERVEPAKLVQSVASLESSESVETVETAESVVPEVPVVAVGTLGQIGPLKQIEQIGPDGRPKSARHRPAVLSSRKHLRRVRSPAGARPGP